MPEYNPKYNQQKAAQFVPYLLDVLNHASLSLMLSLAHRTKLFDVMGEMEPATSEAIADKADLNERYVRECLGALVTGKIVDYDPKQKTYHLPPEHVDFLTRKASPNNIAVMMQFIPVLAQVEDKILECFHKGGGIGYDDFPGFHRVMAEDSDQTIVSYLIDTILPLDKDIVKKLQQGINVADIGCGSGHALNLMAKHFPNSHFVGYDLCPDALISGTQYAKEHNIENVEFIEKDATSWDEKDVYDLIVVFDAIHDQARPDIVLRNIYNALKSDGTFLMQDIKTHSELSENMDSPITPFAYAVSCMHCMTVSLAQGGMGLGTCWGKELALDMLKEAGFNHVDVYELEHDIQNYYYIAKK